MLSTLLYGTIAVFATMSITWLIQLKYKNAGIVDVTWSYNFALLAYLYFIFSDGFYDRKVLITSMAFVWSLRLGTYLYRRNVGKTEDARYTQLRRKWAPNEERMMLGFFYLQGVLNLVLAMPFLLIVTNPYPKIHVLEWIGFCIWIIAICGESLADWQLSKFKKNPANSGGICNVGLWNYSRHPNYFFEWIIWIAFFIVALASPYGYFAILSPIIMLWFLLKMTGIPATEEHMLRTRGKAFEEYMQTTSAFIPWIKK